jgi:glycine dehydrogenase
MPIEPNRTAPAAKSALTELEDHAAFMRRHIGPDEAQISRMLGALGVESLDALIKSTLPQSIQMDAPLALPEAQSESAVLHRLREIADLNILKHSMIGMGYHDTITLPTHLTRRKSPRDAWKPC